MPPAEQVQRMTGTAGRAAAEFVQFERQDWAGSDRRPRRQKVFRTEPMSMGVTISIESSIFCRYRLRTKDMLDDFDGFLSTILQDPETFGQIHDLH